MGENLLLHSLLDLEPLLSNLLRRACLAHREDRKARLLEIGVGNYSSFLHNSADLEVELTSVDPDPVYVHGRTVKTTSLKYLDVSVAEQKWDVALIDGDHNYYTVRCELERLYAMNPLTIAVLHDVGWPWGRRDMYYDPKQIPNPYLLPHSWENGPTFDDSELQPWGFRGMGKYAVALKEGGPRNGVMTAIEDFLKPDTLRLRLSIFPSVFGLAVIEPYECVGDGAADVNEIPNELLERLERNRMRLYSEVLKLQWMRGAGR